MRDETKTTGRPWTPGPWRLDAVYQRQTSDGSKVVEGWIVDADGMQVVEVDSDDSRMVMWAADAQLLVMAAEMAEAILAWASPANADHRTGVVALFDLAEKLRKINGTAKRGGEVTDDIAKDALDDCPEVEVHPVGTRDVMRELAEALWDHLYQQMQDGECPSAARALARYGKLMGGGDDDA